MRRASSKGQAFELIAASRTSDISGLQKETCPNGQAYARYLLNAKDFVNILQVHHEVPPN
jgi:hypothetical protein